MKYSTALLSFWLLTLPAGAAITRTWAGINPANAYWSVASNWSPAGVPQTGDVLQFQYVFQGATSTTNDLLGVTLRGLVFYAGYTISGNTVLLNNTNDWYSSDCAIVCNDWFYDDFSANINCGIQLQSDATFEVNPPDENIFSDAVDHLYLNGPINLNGFNLEIAVEGVSGSTYDRYGQAHVSGVISGVGNVQTFLEPYSVGNPLVEFSGSASNSFTGMLAAGYGTTYLNHQAGSAVSTELDVGGTVKLSRPNQINDSAKVSVIGLLDLNGNNEAILDLEMLYYGVVDTHGANLTLLRNLSSRSDIGEIPVIKGNLVLNGNHTFDLTGYGAYGLYCDANISGSAGFFKTGPGILRLDGSNSFAGLVTVLAGGIEANTNKAFGSSANGASLDGGFLILRAASIASEPLSVNGPSAALTAISNCVWGGPISLYSQLAVTGSAEGLTLSGAITGTDGLLLTGSTIELAGSSANTFSGPIVAQCSLLRLNKASGVRAFSSPLEVGGIPGPQSEVRWLNSLQLPSPASVTLHTNALLSLTGFTEIIDQLTFNGGHINLGLDGALTLTSDVVINPASTTALIDGATNLGVLFLSGQRTFNVPAGTASPDLQIDSRISGSSGLIKTGPGTLSLRGNNLFTGATLVKSGILLADHDNALGSSASGNTVVSNGATLWLGANASNVPESLILNGDGVGGTNGALTGTSSVIASGPISLASASTIRAEAGASFHLTGIISGTGPLTKNGPGNLYFSGSSANTYSGDTLVNDGYLLLNRPNNVLAVPGRLVISGATVRYIAGSNAVNGPIVVNQGGLYDLNGWSEDLGSIGSNPPLTLNSGGDAQTGAGRLNLAAGTTIVVDPGNNGSSTISGRLGLAANIFGGGHTFDVKSPLFIGAGVPLTVSASLEAISSTASVIKTGTGEMRLSGSNTFTGSLTVNAGQVTLANNYALGAAGVGVLVSSNAVLALDGPITISGEPLGLNSSAPVPFATLNGNCVWNGTVALDQDSTINVNSGSSLVISNAISGPGALTKLGPASLTLAGATANTYTNLTSINEGTLVLSNSGANQTILGNVVVGDGVGGVNADVLRLGRINQIGPNSAITINSSGLFDLNGLTETVAMIAGAGNISLGAGSFFHINSTNVGVFDGVISGSGALLKEGSGGKLTVNGNQTFIGNLYAYGGAILVNGSNPQIPVTVGGGTLGGSGTVRNILVSSGSVTPGNSPGILTCSNVTFDGGSYVVELNGTTAGSGYDQLNVRGTVNLPGNPTLTVIPGFGLNSSVPAEGAKFTIVQNDGAEAVTNIFSGKPDNSTFTAGGMTFRLDYDGGTGNDIVLTLTNTALRTAGTALITGNGNSLLDPNECNLLSLVLTNTAGDTSTNVQAMLLSDTPGVTVTQPYASYGDIPVAGRRTNATSFQISTAPWFVCGSPINLRVAVQTANHGAYGVPVALTNAGTIGAPVRFDNNAESAIPDLGTTNILFNVSGLGVILDRVEVAFHLSHTVDSDLDIYLVGPDNTRVELTTDNGGTFDDYGTSCNDTDRTRFSDLAGLAITNTSAPFVGTFRPEGFLTNFIGKTGSAVNGTWKLEVTDDSGGGLGTLHCASLFLYPAACAAGGGICELCPNTTLASTVGAGSLIHAGHVIQDGVPSVCGAPKTCPGTSNGGANQQRGYEAHVFRNGPSKSCVTVTLTAADSGAFCTAYTNSFDPANLCANYLADAGDTTVAAPTQTFSCNVTANQTFVLVVDEASQGSGGNYLLQVTGGDCRPQLAIAPTGANRVVVNWTTAAPGYGLESTNKVAATSAIWPPVTNVPNVVNSRYQITNTPSATNQFYRLRKP